ncbi:MAG: M24 family metallopeptidase, partial [Christensenellales bacterium]|nr:M24 family metallopeptidase [Christensenellales bacterium]
IAGSGINGCMLHYGTNHCKLEDGKLLLLDLGARVDGYCADITRTYPINGKYTPRQREIYDIVLRANREVAKAARPGVTLRELNELCKKVLAEGLMAIGKIESADQIGTYYMHGVSHHLGIDTHDCAVNESEGLRAGMVISDEPGLYIDEEEIGIRIEDDLLITEDGCRVLSEAIPREAEEIEALMAR